jgi:hypothetical protein
MQLVISAFTLGAPPISALEKNRMVWCLVFRGEKKPMILPNNTRGEMSILSIFIFFLADK